MDIPNDQRSARYERPDGALVPLADQDPYVAIAPPAALPAHTMIGTPYQDATAWDGAQTAPDDCAIRAQQFIIEQFTGQKFDEMALAQEAAAHGWYAPGHGGTPIADAGKLLEAHGIPVERYQRATMHQLADELAHGHKVILAVNAEDLWRHDPALGGIIQQSGSQAADHAVVVSGIDTSDPHQTRVIVSDPGTGEATASYRLDYFLQAWKASDFTMIATHDPAPRSLPEMANFDYTTGHIPEVCGVPYDEFAAAAQQPDGWETPFPRDEQSPLWGDMPSYVDPLAPHQDLWDGGVPTLLTDLAPGDDCIGTV